MRCIEHRRARAFTAASLLMLAACSPPTPPPVAPPPPPVTPPPAPTPVTPVEPIAKLKLLPLPPPAAVHTLPQLRLQVAQRLVAANPDGTYAGAAPDPLLAIPVLQIELNVDGSVRRIDVLRHPREARDTTQLAIDAVRRAAPFGDVSRLPKPWRFSETFLFNEDRRFKPRTLEP